MSGNATELMRLVVHEITAYGQVTYKTLEQIENFLAAEPEAEPVAWIQPNHLDKAQFMPFLCRVEPKQRDDFVPIYTKPSPARKPMTDEEIADAFYTSIKVVDSQLAAFAEGFRQAEKHHGIDRGMG